MLESLSLTISSVHFCASSCHLDYNTDRILLQPNGTQYIHLQGCQASVHKVSGWEQWNFISCVFRKWQLWSQDAATCSPWVSRENCVASCWFLGSSIIILGLWQDNSNTLSPCSHLCCQISPILGHVGFRAQPTQCGLFFFKSRSHM